MRVLVVDNHPSVGDVEDCLKSHGYEVGTAFDGAEALGKAQENPPDILITDDRILVEDGWALIKTLRADPRFAALKIIIMRWARHEFSRTDLQKLFAEPVALWRVECIIVKPCREDTFIKIVNDLAADKPLDKMVY